MLDLQSVGENIRELRTRNGLSQDYIAELLGVSHQAVSRWENGLAAPSIDNVIELCQVLDVSFDQLLCLDREIRWDAKDIFKGHSRMFVVKQIINQSVQYDVAANFHLFLPQERMLILRAVKEGKLQTNTDRLKHKLTIDELKYLRGKQ